MKGKLLFILLLVSLTLHAQPIRYDTIRYAKKHYQKRIEQFSHEPVVKGCIVLLGNSLTEFGDWKRLMNDKCVVNRGVAADNTFGVLERLEDIIQLSPRLLIIEIGINDISQGIPDTIIVNNIFKIAGGVKRRCPSTGIAILSILPSNDNVKTEYPEVYHKNPVASRINVILKQRSIQLGYSYLDLNSKLSNSNGDLDTRYSKPDGLHLNESGYGIWVKMLNHQAKGE